MYQFAFDEQKSTSSLKKHGIDFVTAQELWSDPDLIEIKANSDDEPRHLIVASFAGKHWSAVVTYRRDTIRLISVRRPRKSEVQLYES